jgi:hypothetical protein
MVLSINIHGNSLTVFHDLGLHSRQIMRNFFRYVHKTPAFKALGLKILEKDYARGTLICEDEFRANDRVHYVFSKPIPAELIQIYVDAMEKVEHSLAIRESFARPFTYPLVDSLFNTLTGNPPVPEYDPHAPILFLSDEDKQAWVRQFLSQDYMHFQPLNTPDCVVVNRPQLTWWHHNQINQADGILRIRAERHADNKQSLYQFAIGMHVLPLVAIVCCILAKHCCPPRRNHPRND